MKVKFFTMAVAVCLLASATVQAQTVAKSQPNLKRPKSR